jgi:hypothetical protein
MAHIDELSLRRSITCISAEAAGAWKEKQMKKEQRAKKRRGAIIIFVVKKIGGEDDIACTKKD